MEILTDKLRQKVIIENLIIIKFIKPLNELIISILKLTNEAISA